MNGRLPATDGQRTRRLSEGYVPPAGRTPGTRDDDRKGRPPRPETALAARAARRPPSPGRPRRNGKGMTGRSTPRLARRDRRPFPGRVAGQAGGAGREPGRMEATVQDRRSIRLRCLHFPAGIGRRRSGMPGTDRPARTGREERRGSAFTCLFRMKRKGTAFNGKPAENSKFLCITLLATHKWRTSYPQKDSQRYLTLLIRKDSRFRDAEPRVNLHGTACLRGRPPELAASDVAADECLRGL